MTELDALVKKDHVHPGDPAQRKNDTSQLVAAQSVIDQNMYVFSKWVTDTLKDVKGLKRSQKLLLRGFFKFVQKNLHRAVCAETWHYLGELTEKIVELSTKEDANLDELAQKLAEQETRIKLKEALSLSDEDADKITAVEIARAFRKMFRVEASGLILSEFRQQVAFVEEKLRGLGFP